MEIIYFKKGPCLKISYRFEGWADLPLFYFELNPNPAISGFRRMGFSPSVPVVAKITSNLFIDGLQPIRRFLPELKSPMGGQPILPNLQVIKSWYDRICGVNPKSEI